MYPIKSVSELIEIFASNPLENVIASLKYLTTWVVVLVVFGKWTHRYIDLVFLSGFVFISALYITHIDPGYLKYRVVKKEYQITDFARRFINFAFHTLPLIFALLLQYKSPPSAFAVTNALLIILIYMVAFDVRIEYDVNSKMIVGLLALYISAYLLFL